MTRPELEVMFREQIDYFFNCGPARKDRDTSYDLLRLIILTFRTPEDNSDAEVQLSYNYITRRLIFDIVLKMDDGNDRTSFWVSNIPESEGEYFQESTVKDMYFTWEFYQYLENILLME